MEGSDDLNIFKCGCLNWNANLVLRTSTRRPLIRILNRNNVYECFELGGWYEGIFHSICKI